MTVVTIRQTHDPRSFLDRKSSLPALVVAPGATRSNFRIQHMHCLSSVQTLLQFVTNFDVGKQTHCDLRRVSFVSPYGVVDCSHTLVEHRGNSRCIIDDHASPRRRSEYQAVGIYCTDVRGSVRDPHVLHPSRLYRLSTAKRIRPRRHLRQAGGWSGPAAAGRDRTRLAGYVASLCCQAAKAAIPQRKTRTVWVVPNAGLSD